MSKKENHNILESIREAIVKDPHLHDRVLTVIREIRETTGQTMEQYIQKKEEQGKGVEGRRKKAKQK